MRPVRLLFVLVLATVLYSNCLVPKKGPQREFTMAKKYLPPFDAIIVPGIPYNNGHWDTVMKARVIWSWILYKNGVTKNVIFSGDAVYSPYYESKIMGLYAQKLGIPKEHIFYDTLAQHSTENVYYSYLLAKKLGFKRIALASDPFQSALLKGMTRTRFETPIYHMAFVVDSIAKYNYINPSINPKPALKKDFKSLPDEESPGKRFLGTLGGDINWSQYKGGIVPGL